MRAGVMERGRHPAMVPRRSTSSGERDFRFHFLPDRQRDTEDGATARAVLVLNGTVVFVDDAVGGAQAKARSLADRLRRVKGIEDALRVLDAGPVVGELDEDGL